MLITHEIAARLLTQTEPLKFAAEASDLGLQPGEWPSQIRTEIGNRMPFLRGPVQLDAEGGIASITYRQCSGCIDLTIFND